MKKTWTQAAIVRWRMPLQKGITHRPFWKTGQGVCGSGEAKCFKHAAKAKAIASMYFSTDAQRMKVRLVTASRSEARWSSPGQGEVARKCGGSPYRCWFKPLEWPGIRGEKPIESCNSWFLSKWVLAQPGYFSISEVEILITESRGEIPSFVVKLRMH